jgi:hypothetical protein
MAMNMIDLLAIRRRKKKQLFGEQMSDAVIKLEIPIGLGDARMHFPTVERAIVFLPSTRFISCVMVSSVHCPL